MTTDSSQRYEVPGKAVDYAARSPRRQAAEVGLLERLLDRLEGQLGATLDVPCGGGRLAEVLGRRGAVWHGADRAAAMLTVADDRDAGGGPRRLFRAAIERLPFRERSFETVVCFRLLHHFSVAAQRAVVSELARVTSHHLIVSAFHPISLHHLERRVVGTLTRRDPSRFATSPGTLDSWLAELGFESCARVRQGALRDLWVGAWKRARDASFRADKC